MSEVLKLEGIANRDSLPYAETYELGRVEGLRTLVRGTIRCVFPSVLTWLEIAHSSLIVAADTLIHTDTQASTP